jgi:hypothetical protein
MHLQCPRVTRRSRSFRCGASILGSSTARRAASSMSPVCPWCARVELAVAPAASRGLVLQPLRSRVRWLWRCGWWSSSVAVGRTMIAWIAHRRRTSRRGARRPHRMRSKAVTLSAPAGESLGSWSNAGRSTAARSRWRCGLWGPRGCPMTRPCRRAQYLGVLPGARRPEARRHDLADRVRPARSGGERRDRAVVIGRRG